MNMAANNPTNTLSDAKPINPVRRPRQKPRAWWVMLALALLIAVYGFAYVVLGDRMFNEPLASSFRARPWGIFTHALFASIALLVGPFQFHRGILIRWRIVHRYLGIVYILAAVIGSGLVGSYMAWHSYGGWITHSGFGLLALGVLITTSLAYIKIRMGEVAAHREWMIRSYALIFGAVTLRVWLPILVILYHGQFQPAYRWVAWVSWVPNLVAVEWYLRRSRSRQSAAAALLKS
jgi:uncharacterized membrane protein